MRSVAVLSCLVIALAAASTTQAGLVRPFKKSDSTAMTITKIKVNLRHVQFVCDKGKREIKQIHCNAVRWLSGWLKKLATPVLSVPHYSAWMCIHSGWKNGVKVGSGEGSWTDSGDPYWGGLQMDRGFMNTYAPKWLLKKGLANSWTPLEQMFVAERAYRSGRGFGPWPNTARSCGLL